MCPSHTHCPGAASSVFILFSFIFSFWFGPFLLFPLFFLCPCRVWVRIGTRSGSKGTAEKPPGVPCCLSMDTLHVQLCPSPFPKAFSHFLGFLPCSPTGNFLGPKAHPAWPWTLPELGNFYGFISCTLLQNHPSMTNLLIF